MRLFVVIPHYFGPPDPGNSSPVSSSYLEPLSRIAALNETIVSLHRNFGPYRNTIEGTELEPPVGGARNILDIVVLTMRDRHVLPDLGLDPRTFSVEYVEGRPTQIPFHAQHLMRERAGRYDFYCLIEHDLAIHDPAFFKKLAWFQRNFGPIALLAPTRVETAATGTPGKVIVDPVLPPNLYERFRRAAQRTQLSGVWNDSEYRFALPSNPHAASYFLTQEQLSHWMGQPSFDDRDDSWVGPIESAVTLGIGKVFDIYKAVSPDPFFLEVHHFGAAFASINPPQGRRHGEPPLLAIAQNAMRTAHKAGSRDLLSNMGAWLDEGTLAEQIAHLTHAAAEREGLRAARDSLCAELGDANAAIAGLEDEIKRLRHEVNAASSEAEARGYEIDGLRDDLVHASTELHRQRHSLRWLVRAIVAEVSRRIPWAVQRARAPAE